MPVKSTHKALNMALDQSNRYANLDLDEQQLIRDGKHVLVAYHMKPKEGFGGFVETAAHFAAESSTGTNVEGSTTDAFTRGVDAIVYEADERRELIKLAYPVELFDRNRLYGGLGYALADRRKLQLGYMIQTTDTFSKGQLQLSFHHVF